MSNRSAARSSAARYPMRFIVKAVQVEDTYPTLAQVLPSCKFGKVLPDGRGLFYLAGKEIWVECPFTHLGEVTAEWCDDLSTAQDGHFSQKGQEGWVWVVTPHAVEETRLELPGLTTADLETALCAFRDCQLAKKGLPAWLQEDIFNLLVRAWVDRRAYGHADTPVYVEELLGKETVVYVGGKQTAPWVEGYEGDRMPTRRERLKAWNKKVPNKEG